MIHKKTFLFIFTALVFLSGNILKAQSDFTSGTRHNVGSETPIEGANYRVEGTTDNIVPMYLYEKLDLARESGDMAKFDAVQEEIKQYMGDAYVPAPTNTGDEPMTKSVNPPFVPEWYTTDRLVHTGNLNTGGWRQIDLKQGEDGNLYIAVNRQNTGTAMITVYRSTNYGVTWTSVNGVQASGAWYGQVSMIVDLRSDSGNLDSTRITLFYTRSTTNSSMYDATVNYASFRRDGSAWYTAQIGGPTSGRKLLYPTGLSDGQYWGTATYWGVVVGDYINGTSIGDNIKFFKSVNWGASWTSSTFNTTYNDYYPTAAYDDGGATSSDSVYIAVERRFNTTNYLTRVIVCAWTPSTGSYTHFVPPTGSDKYEKPCIAIPQTGAYQNSTGRRMIITCTKNGNGVYHMNTNGGNGGWQVDGFFNGRASLFTWAGTDSNVTAGNYCTVVWTTISSDSVGYRQGQIGSLGTTYHKRNSNNSSPSVNPVCETYKTTGTARYAAIAYAGFGPTNVYYNGETIFTGVNQTGNTIPESFSLAQNFPNPFNPVTNINFSLPKAGLVKLVVYDVMGKEVNVLVNQQMNAGSYKVDYDGSGLSSGVYFYRLDAEGFSAVKKMMLVK